MPSEPWRRNQLAVLIAVFTSFLGFSFVIPFLPLYIRELGVTDLGQAAALAGLTFGISPLLSGLLAPLWGIIADRHGMKIIVQRALISFAILNFLMSLVVDPYQLLALRACIGLLGGFGPMLAALVTVGAPQQEVGPAIGKLQATQILASAVGPLIGGIIADTLGIRVSFVLTSALCLISLVLITVLYRQEKVDQTVRQGKGRLSFGALLSLPGFLPLLVILLLAQIIDRGFGPVMPLFIAELDPNVPIASTAGLVFSAGSFVSALAASQVGRLTNRFDARLLLPVSLAIGLLATAPLIFVNQIWELFAVRLLFGVAVGTTATLAFAAAARVVPMTSRGTAFGFLGSATSMATAFGPMGAGALAAFSLRYVFVADTLIYILVVAIGLVIYLRPQKEPLPDQG